MIRSAEGCSYSGGPPEFSDRARWRAATIRALAGPVTESRLTGQSIRAALRRNASDRATAVALVALGLAPTDRNEVLRDLFNEARTLVDQHWGAILAVARALAISRELLGHEVERLVRRAAA